MTYKELEQMLFSLANKLSSSPGKSILLEAAYSMGNARLRLLPTCQLEMEAKQVTNRFGEIEYKKHCIHCGLEWSLSKPDTIYTNFPCPKFENDDVTLPSSSYN